MGFQNPDGGFGESTLSYLDDGHRRRGTSTPTQTAWVLEFLCELGLQAADPVSKAVNYLLETWSESESWRDGSVVGTGNPSCAINLLRSKRVRKSSVTGTVE